MHIVNFLLTAGKGFFCLFDLFVDFSDDLLQIFCLFKILYVFHARQLL